MTAVGFLGTGAMGSAMALRLLANNYSVLVHNRTEANARQVLDAGAQWAAKPVDLADQCEVVLGCLRDTQAVEHVYLAPSGLLDNARSGTIFVEHGTFSPELARLIADRARSKDCTFIDLPVTGGPAGALAGTLTGMAGGDPQSIEAVRPVLACYLQTIHHMGPAGRGLELKLVNQVLVTTHMAAAAEAIALLRALDLPVEQSGHVLTEGWANSAMLTRAVRQITADQLTDTGVTIQGMSEVQALIHELLTTRGISAEVYHSARDAFDRAIQLRRGPDDPATLADIVASAALPLTSL